MPEISKVADDAISVLLKLSDAGPLTPTELARSLGLNRTAVHRLLTTLHRRGLVVRQEEGYLLGPAILDMAERVQPALRAAAAGVMTTLRDEIEETIILSVVDGDEAVVLHECVDTSHVLRVDHRVGTRTPLHLGCGGLALLAWLSPTAVRRALHHVDDPDAIAHRLQTIRTAGYSLTHDELKLGVHGIAAPVFDERGNVIASIAIIEPAARAALLRARSTRLQQAAADVRTALLAGVPVSVTS